ncbi:MAG: T9SS type A sorting domain-containing protein [Saprospiraceae bacterium]|nr:T9SS type A sorting domain-containing protein [Saprospiraceae bacterium]
MKDKRDEKERSYQRFDTTLKFQYNPEFKYLVICLQDQNDSVSSVIGLDNIELCTSEVPLNTYSEQYGKLGIYPNPSTGHFIIEMQQAAKSGSKFRIMDLNGRMIIEKQTVIGNQNQNIDASSLASGFYFLQFISEGKIIAVEKLMKQ